MSNMTDLWLSGVFFQVLNTPKLGPPWGSLRRSPRLPSRLGRGHPLLIPLSHRRLRRLDLGAIVVGPPTLNSWLKTPIIANVNVVMI